MPLTVINGPIIPAGEAMSDAVDCSNGEIVRITMPAEWTPASLGIEISSDGMFFNPLANYLGQEIVINVLPGSAVAVPLDWSRAIAFMRVRSGTRDRPVPQEKQRDFAVAVKKGADITQQPALSNYENDPRR